MRCAARSANSGRQRGHVANAVEDSRRRPGHGAGQRPDGSDEDQGVMVTAPGKPKEVSFACRIKPKADYTDLQAVLPSP